MRLQSRGRILRAIVGPVTGGLAVALLAVPAPTALAQAAAGAAPAARAAVANGPALVGTNPDDKTPFATNGQVQALAQVGDRVIVGGSFKTVRNAGTGADLARSYLFAYNRVTGKVDAGFVPILDGVVQALQASSDGGTVFVGGLFKTVNGTPRAYLARIDVATGALVTGFSANLNGQVGDLDLVGGKLYAAGWFSKARGLARGGLAAFAETTGALDLGLDLPLVTTRVPDGIRTVNVTADAGRMVIAGNFTSVGGVARDQVAVIDLTTAAASVRADWNTSSMAFSCLTGCTSSRIHTYIRDVDLSADGRYFVLGTTFYLPGNGDSLSRFEVDAAGPDLAPTWIRFTGTDTITAVQISPQGPIYLGGHFRWFNTTPYGPVAGQITRYGLAAVSPQTGLAYDWAPTRERGYGVLAMLVTSDGDLVIGHDTNTVGGERHPRLAMFPLLAGRASTVTATPALPVDVTLVQPDQSVAVHTWSGAAVTATATAGFGLDGSIRAGFAVADGVLLATTSGFRYESPDPYGGWVLQRRLAIAGLNPASVNAMAFADETFYYSAADGAILTRAMSSDSLLVDPTPRSIAVPGSVVGLDLGRVRGLFASTGSLWASTTAGDLFALPLTAPGVLAGTATKVSGPALDGVSWSATALIGSGPPVAGSYRPDLALGMPVGQSSTDFGGVAERAVDGNRDGQFSIGSTTQTLAATATSAPWWQVDLGSSQPLTGVALWTRADCCQERLANVSVFVSDTPFTSTDLTATGRQAGVSTLRFYGIVSAGTELALNRTGRYVRVQTAGLEGSPLSLTEVEVYGSPGAPPPAPRAGTNLALRQPVGRVIAG